MILTSQYTKFYLTNQTVFIKADEQILEGGGEINGHPSRDNDVTYSMIGQIGFFLGGGGQNNIAIKGSVGRQVTIE